MEEKFEPLIAGLLDNGFGSLDDFISPQTVAGLRTHLLHAHDTGLTHAAGIGQKLDKQNDKKVRGDEILWLENDTVNPFERAFFDQVDEFILYLNRSCYTGINDYEFHYAYYEPGSFYKRHLDQFKNNQDRKFSLVTYLNEDWLSSDGGNLSMYMEEGEETILATGGRSVFFKSDEIEHEVHPSDTRYRLSITGWLKVV